MTEQKGDEPAGAGTDGVQRRRPSGLPTGRRGQRCKRAALAAVTEIKGKAARACGQPDAVKSGDADVRKSQAELPLESRQSRGRGGPGRGGGRRGGEGSGGKDRTCGGEP